MPLEAGSRIGPYQFVALIGEGGMGKVWRAHHTALRRDDALKVLPDNFASNPDRAARFQREAQVLASLNHPNIAHIYGLEEADGVQALVMELVEGPTLADRISQGPIPIDEALPIAKQIAEALEAAHEQGIIHRDLKPANIKVRSDGTVKVLDFGLAKALEPASGASLDATASPTITSPALMTGAGVLLGTAAYMSPEQARGKAIDTRADIWAFDCVLYEMLTGNPAFPGEDIAEILGGVMRAEPDWTSLPASTPAAIRLLLRRCLEKNPARRYHAAADVLIQIEDSHAAPESALHPSPASVARVPSMWSRTVTACLAALVASIVTGILVWILRPAPPAGRVSRVAIPLVPGTTLDANAIGMFALSRDGARIAYVASRGGAARQLYVRALDSGETRALPGTEGAATPFFSPDGRWIGFNANSRIKKVASTGGAVLDIADAINIRGAVWGADDTIVFSPTLSSSLFQVSAAGGPVQQLTTLQEGDSYHRWPHLLPDGKTLLFAAGSAGVDDASVVALRMDTRERKLILPGGSYPHFLPTGHLVYYRAGTMMAVPFDAATLQLTGDPEPVLEGVRGAAGDSQGGQFSVSNDGTLVYVPGGPQAIRRASLVWVDRTARDRPVAAPERPYANPRLSPDGRVVAVNVTDDARQDIWTYDLTRDTLTRLTFDGTGNNFPQWTPDGRRVIYRSFRPAPNLFWKSADGSGAEERLTTSQFLQTPLSVSPDGRTLVFTELNAKTSYDLLAMSLDGDRTPRPIIQTPFDDRIAQLSPDGRWIAYISNESGTYEVYVQPFPGPGGKQQISSGGGAEIVWAKNGELFYRTGPELEKMMVVDFEQGPVLRAGKPRLLFEGPYLSNAANASLSPNYSVSADGQRLLMLKATGGQSGELTQINLVMNWFDELKRLVPVN